MNNHPHIPISEQIRFQMALIDKIKADGMNPEVQHMAYLLITIYPRAHCIMHSLIDLKRRQDIETKTRKKMHRKYI